MMPLLFSLGQHPALVRVQSQLEEGEYLMAFLDDMYTVSMPDRVQEIHSLLEAALWSEAGIRVAPGENPSVESGWRGTSWMRRVYKW